MSDQLFVITGGGTGAKVAEALTHVCAAGIAPGDVHVLMIDSDAENGNVLRAVSAIQSYSKLQSYPWGVENRNDGSWFGSNETSGGWIEPFSSNLHLHRLTKPLSTVLDGGLQTVAGNSEDLDQVLKLLYDKDERYATCEDGFRARPNIGCLLLSEHLNEELVNNPKARSFLDKLANAASGRQSVPVVVTASVFGGTGASLLPVIRGCVEEAFRTAEGNLVNTDRLHWNAVKILPHYEPARRKESVDPDRFLLDTSSTLQFYSKVYRTKESDTYDGVYIIGSDQPDRNRVEVELGSKQQSNPGYFEEFVAALAIVDAGKQASNGAAEQIRVYEPESEQRYIQWRDLPYEEGARLRDGFAYLLHLAAFHLRRGRKAELTKGLARLIEGTPPGHLRQFAWYQNLIDPWAQHNSAYDTASKDERPKEIKDNAVLGSLTYNSMVEEVAEYFGRLLLWAETALKGEHLALVDYRNADYVAVHHGMCTLSEGDIDAIGGGASTNVQPEEDNALIRTLRAALLAMMRLRHGDIRLRLPIDGFRLVDGDEIIPLCITKAGVEDALGAHQLPNVADAFTRTLISNGTS